MKKLIAIIAIIASLSLPAVSHAALTPTSWLRDTVAGFLRPNITTDTLRIPSLTSCDTIDTDADGDLSCGTDGGGGGGSTALDLGDNGSNESSGLTEIATSGDTNSIFSEPSADKLLINLALDWPKSDTSDDLTCTDCIGATEISDVYVLNAGDTMTGDLELDGDLLLNLDDTGALRFSETDANGSNFKGFTAPTAITTSTTCTFEDDANFIPDSCVGDGTDDVGGVTDFIGLSDTFSSYTGNGLNLVRVNTGETALEPVTLRAGRIFLGNASDKPVETAVSGDVTINSSGVTTIGANKILESMLKAVDTPADEECLTSESTTGDFEWQSCGGGGGAPTTVDYLVGTADAGLSAEIVVGTTPGGELGGTWASPTLDDSVSTTGWSMGTFSGTTLTAGTVNIDLLDGVGAVDMDYGSADITDHTFVTDGTGTAEIVLPAGSIDGTEILNDTVALTTDTSGNYVSSATASGGLTLTGTEGGSLGVLLPAATDALSATTSSGSGLQLLASGLTLLQGCSDNQVLKWVESTDTWDCSTPSGSGTVTATGGSLTSNAVVLGAGTTDTKVSTGITTDGGSQLNLGVNATTLGKLKLFGNTSGDATIQTPAVAGTATVLTLPAATGTLATLAGTETFSNKTVDPASNVLSACIPVAVTDEYSNLTTGTAKVTFRMPYAMTVTSVRASLVTVATGGTLVAVDINEGGTTILSTKLTFDASELTTTSAATAAVVSDSSLADDALMTVDIDAVGNTTPGNGLKISICGTI